MYIIYKKEYNTMSTEMQRIDPFGLPDDFKEKIKIATYKDYDYDLHDNYDLLSQPLDNSNFHFNVGEKNEQY